MTLPFAVFTGLIGARSETFIRRHVLDLLPHRTLVITRKLSNEEPSDWKATGPVLELESNSWAQIADSLRAYKVEVLMGEYLDESLSFMDTAMRLGIRFFGHAHGYDVSENLRDPFWQREYLRYTQAAGIITMNHVSRERLIALGLPSDRVHTVPYGVDVPDESPKHLRRLTVKCLAVGRMVEKKAPLKALEAFRLAAETHPELRLEFVGSGPLFGAAREFISEFALEEKVRLAGSQPNHVVHQMMLNADIFLQHSITDPKTGDQEGLPVAILEAMAHALPVVSTHHAGIPEAVLDGITGLLSNEGDTKEMAENIRHLVDHASQSIQMGADGWARAKQYFSWERERASLLKILGLDS